MTTQAAPAREFTATSPDSALARGSAKAQRLAAEPTVAPVAAPATPLVALWARPEGGRRILNVLVAGIGIILALPLMLLIAIAVRLSSLGPVRYTQTRIGVDRRRRGTGTDTGTRHRDLGGVPFRMFKFRTMHVHESDVQRWATVGDARVTGVGRVLRQYRIDELPQLFNVLFGDMNVVGPRPEQPQIFAHLRTRIALYGRRQHVRPGITGWAQVNLAYDQNEEDARRKLQYDLEYIGRQSLSEDLRIMMRTLPVMLGRRGAH